MLEKGEGLWPLILRPASKLADPANIKIYTWYRIQYARHFYARLYQFFDSHLETVETNKLILYLLSLNFNHSLFLNYLINNVFRQPGNNGADEIIHLKWWQKSIAQNIPRMSERYVHTAPDLQKQLLDWLENELTHCYDNLEPETSGAGKQVIVQSKLNRDEIAALVRLLFEKGIVYHPNKSELFRLIGPSLKTKQATGISPLSLANKFNDISPRTARTLRQHIMDMLIELKKFE